MVCDRWTKYYVLLFLKFESFHLFIGKIIFIGRFVSRNIVDINLVVLLRYVANHQVVEVSYLQTWTGQTTLLPIFMLFQPKLYLNWQQLLDWIFVG